MAEEGKRQDRELIELLNELRVVLPGVQVLFAFLLTVPFTQAWPKVTAPQEGAYFIALCCTVVAIALLIAPTTFHRIRFRDRDKEKMLRLSNVYAIVGAGFLGLAIASALYLVTDFLFGGAIGALVTAIGGGMITLLWFGVPLLREAKD